MENQPNKFLFKDTAATKRIFSLNKRIRAVAGGTAASKTISILVWLIDYAQTVPNEVITVTSESYPHLSGGAIRDFKSIMVAHNYWDENAWNESKHIYTFKTGTIIEFMSFDKFGKAHGPRRDILFLNEANNLPYNIVDQLITRTRKIVWMDWNPSSEFWFYSEMRDKRDDIDFITLTYKDNEALDEITIREIESHKGNKNWWLVYGLGQLGELEGKIYKDWQIIDEIPHEARLERYGLDFGYSQDAAAIVAIYYYNGGYIVDEELYQKGLTNNQLADFIKNRPPALIMADSAEPKSIDELKQYGLNILPCVKGQDSVTQGINYVQQQKISMTRRSLNLIKEYRNYLWMTDKDGTILPKPDKGFDHCLSGDTLVWTTQGKIKIKDLVGKSGYIYTPYGIKKFSDVHRSGYQGLLEIETDYGKLRCTTDHKLQMDDGKWKKAIDIKPLELIQWIYEDNYSVKNNPRVQWSKILAMWQKLFPKMLQRGKTFAPTSGGLGVPQWINPYGISYSSQRRGQNPQPDRKLRFNEEGVAPILSLDSRKEKVGKCECSQNGNAESDKLAQVQRGQRMASPTRIGSGVRVKSTKEIPTKVDVFDLSVQDLHCFIVNEGFVVKNSMDALRYGFESLKPSEKPISFEKVTSDDDLGFSHKYRRRRDGVSLRDMWG